MSEPEIQDPLADWMRLAADAEASPCPPVETLFGSAVQALAEAEERTVRRHLERCPRCAAEAERAAAPPPADDEDLAFVVARLEREVPRLMKNGGGRVLGWPARRPAPKRSFWTLLAAAGLVMLVGTTVQQVRNSAPDLGAPPTADSVRRGGRIHGLAPDGPLDIAPSELRWQPTAEASDYAVSIFDVTDGILWGQQVDKPWTSLPATVLQSLHAGGTYRWRVEAFDGQGQTLAAGEATIRIAPSAQQPPA